MVRPKKLNEDHRIWSNVSFEKKRSMTLCSGVIGDVTRKSPTEVAAFGTLLYFNGLLAIERSSLTSIYNGNDRDGATPVDAKSNSNQQWFSSRVQTVIFVSLSVRNIVRFDQHSSRRRVSTFGYGDGEVSARMNYPVPAACSFPNQHSWRVNMLTALHLL